MRAALIAAEFLFQKGYAQAWFKIIVGAPLTRATSVASFSPKSLGISLTKGLAT
jgi:hypothetical protein